MSIIPSKTNIEAQQTFQILALKSLDHAESQLSAFKINFSLDSTGNQPLLQMKAKLRGSPETGSRYELLTVDGFTMTGLKHTLATGLIAVYTIWTKSINSLREEVHWMN